MVCRPLQLIGSWLCRSGSLRIELRHRTVVCSTIVSIAILLGAGREIVVATGSPPTLLTQEDDAETAIEPQPAGFDFEGAQELLSSWCSDCHGEGADEGDFAIEELAEPNTLSESFERWQKVRQRIVEKSMPPADYGEIPDQQRIDFAEWVESESIAALCADGSQAGPPLLRRLAKHEYSNSVRDLLNIHFDAGQGLPADTAGGEGFANAAETLIISPIHAEKYLEAAEDALEYAAKDESARRRLLRSTPNEETSEVEAARRNLNLLASRAFRRPVADEEVARFVKLYEDARSDELTFDQSVLYAMRGILISPSFLFIRESQPQKRGVSELVTDHELAVRLSYFLWASAPDDELRRLADAGKLQEEDVLREQVKRLIEARGTHLQDSLTEFMGSWLGTADLGVSKRVDRDKHRWVRDPHVAALRKQPIVAMEIILQENRSLLELIDADWTVINSELVGAYRLKGNKLDGDFAQRLVKVGLPDEYRYRGGLLGMGGTMAVSSYPRRSSPVLRGTWVLEKMLGVELPPPPPDVPALDDEHHKQQPATLRQRLEQHRADPSCATCHNRIDPIGFALENFDELGRWRDEDEGGKIDAVAELPDGSKIDSVAGLKSFLLENKRTFVRELTKKMLGYALGRSLRPDDLCTVEEVVAHVEQNDYRSQELILGIVLSKPFREKFVPEAQKETAP